MNQQLNWIDTYMYNRYMHEAVAAAALEFVIRRFGC